MKAAASGARATSVVEHRGRPRDPVREAAIRDAVLALVAEEGYDRVTIERVAARAGVGKATVYRRWESKAELVLDAIAHLTPAFSVPDTGSLREDLGRLCASAAITGSQGHRTMAVMQGLVSAIPHDRALMEVFSRRFVAPRRAALATVFARAMERGEMPAGKDIDLLTSVIPAMMMHRLLTGHPVPGRGFAARIIDQLLLPAATASPEPVAGTGRRA